MVTDASIRKPNVIVESFKGVHAWFKSNKDVSYLDISNVVVEYFPRNLHLIFPNLKTLIVSNCGLKECFRKDLAGLEGLIEINLSQNQLRTLPDDLFSNMPSLKKIWLNNNRIEFASSNLIQSIYANQIEYFSLLGNTAIDDFFHLNSISGCKMVQELMVEIDERCKPPTDANCDKVDGEILKGFNVLRQSGRLVDFVITVGSREFSVHKACLAIQSSVFGDMFEVKTNGRHAVRLEISDSSAEGVESFLDYLYDRKQPVTQNAMEIFKLAAKYEVAVLKTSCEKIIHASIDESNAFEIFRFACGQHKSEEIKFAAFKILKSKFGDELGDDLMNNPDKLQKIVETKKLFG